MNTANDSATADNNTTPLLFVNTAKIWGGGEHQILQCATGLMRRGYDVTIAARIGSPFHERVARNDIPVLSLGGHSDLSLTDARALRQWLAGHLNSRIICTVSRDIKLVAMATWGKRSDLAVYWMMGAIMLRPRLRDRLLATHLVDRFIVPSRALASELGALGYISDSRISILPNGLDISVWSAPSEGDVSQRQQTAGAGPIIGVFSRLNKQKGIDSLLQAWPQILNQHPTARLWIVGTGPYESVLRAQAQSLGESVEVRGFVEKIRELMLQVDLVVHPSLYETFGIVLLEAMSCRKPVVCTNVGGMVEVIDDTCGRIVPPNKPDQLAVAISDLLSNPDRIEAMGAAGRRRVESAFSLDRMIDHLGRLLLGESEAVE